LHEPDHYHDTGDHDNANDRGGERAFKSTGAGADLQFKTGDSAPAAKTVIHDGFSLPPLDPDHE
jgi:hypothetical protein